MTPIQTFVFMDIGTLYKQPDNVTEVSLLAVPRSQYFHPENIEEPKAKKTLDLRSDGFNLESYNEINDFINQQQKPVCLVSHNGNRFDFPILKRHLQKLNVSLSDDVLCADCMYSFYDILKAGNPCQGIVSSTAIDNDSSNLNNVTNKMFGDIIEGSDQKDDAKQVITEKAMDTQTYNEKKEDDTTLDVDVDQVPNGDITEKERIYPSTSNVNYTVDSMSNQIDDFTEGTDIQGSELREDQEDNNMQSQNEKTPQKQKVNATNEPITYARPKLDSNFRNLGKPKRKRDHDENYTYMGKAVRRIFFENDDIPEVSYKLGDIYDREVMYPPVEHHPVDNDVYMKFRISHKLGKKFLDWADQIQRKFADVKPMKVDMPNKNRF